MLVADNRPQAEARTHGRTHVIPAPGPASPYFARQQAAARAGGEWLVFVDADADAGLLDALFDPVPAATTAILAGAIVDHPRAPYARIANCAVRRSAFAAVGGFPDPVRSGADVDLCWRLAAAGHELEERPAARCGRRDRPTFAQLHRQGSGMQWLDRRYPGAFPLPRPNELADRFRLLARDPVEFASRWAVDFGRLKANGDPTRP